MHIRNLSLKQKNTLANLIKPSKALLNAIIAEGGHPYLVGGAVRDLLLHRDLKDIDIEVHNLSLDELKEVLQKFGPVELVGKAFGVLKLHHNPIDWSLPRHDTAGRKPTVTIDPHMDIVEALRRRDLTINAMAIDLINDEIIDPFSGLEDLENKKLRAPDTKFFAEDPLRFFRVMQFIGRFNMVPDQELNHICRTMDISKISRERIEQEFEKLFLRSKFPSRGIRWLDSIGRLQEILPELAATRNVVQDKRWHPEGDVFEHTMQAVDAAAALAVALPDQHEKLLLIYAALCHDLGKAVTTQILDDKIISYRHEIVGVPLAEKLLKRVVTKKDMIEKVARLVRYHMAPGLLADTATLAAYKRLALKLAPLTNLRMLGLLAYADRRGRNPQGQVPLTSDDPGVHKFMERAQEAEVLLHKEEPILHGRDFLNIVKPGPELGKLVKLAYDIQINKNIKDKEELKKRVLSSLTKKLLAE